MRNVSGQVIIVAAVFPRKMLPVESGVVPFLCVRATYEGNVFLLAKNLHNGATWAPGGGNSVIRLTLLN